MRYGQLQVNLEPSVMTCVYLVDERHAEYERGTGFVKLLSASLSGSLRTCLRDVLIWIIPCVVASHSAMLPLAVHSVPRLGTSSSPPPLLFNLLTFSRRFTSMSRDSSGALSNTDGGHSAETNPLLSTIYIRIQHWGFDLPQHLLKHPVFG